MGKVCFQMHHCVCTVYPHVGIGACLAPHQAAATDHVPTCWRWRLPGPQYATDVTWPQKPQLSPGPKTIGWWTVWWELNRAGDVLGPVGGAFLKMGWATWWVLKMGGVQACGWGQGADPSAVRVSAVLPSCKDPPRGHVPLRPPELVVVCLHMLALAPVPAGQTMRERTGIQEPPLGSPTSCARDLLVLQLGPGRKWPGGISILLEI